MARLLRACGIYQATSASLAENFQVFVCKLSKHTGDLNPCEIIRVIRDEDVRV